MNGGILEEARTVNPLNTTALKIPLSLIFPTVPCSAQQQQASPPCTPCPGTLPSPQSCMQLQQYWEQGCRQPWNLARDSPRGPQFCGHWSQIEVTAHARCCPAEQLPPTCLDPSFGLTLSFTDPSSWHSHWALPHAASLSSRKSRV